MQVTKRVHLRLALLASLLAATMFPAASWAMDLGNGKRLYDVHCAGCHGINGHSIVPSAPNLSRGEKMFRPDFDLVNILKTGTANHPPFLGLMSEKEMLDVVGYARTLR